MDVAITVEVNGKLIKRHVEVVDGTLEQMEETIHAMTQRIAADALQASVDQAAAPRPLFRKTAER
jgi:vacuolar-type H+-ATPase subunit E/Vma4